MADTKFEIILGIPFLKLRNADVLFGKKTFTWKTYTTNRGLPITKQVQIINSKKFVIAALDADSKTFVVHVAIREQEEIAMDPDRKTQIKAQIKTQSGAQSKVQVWALIFNKAPIEVPAKYSNYSDVFSAENKAEFPENTWINKHAIKLEDDKQPPFGLIYSLGSVELEILKIYIETNLANGFIQPSKSLTGAPIFFDRKPNRSLRLCADYWGLNNITIKNRYPLPLIEKSID